MPKSTSRPAPADLPRTIAHHLDQAGTDSAHAQRHIAAAKTAKGGAKAFNLEHAAHHAKAAAGKIADATAAIAKAKPAVGAELVKLAAAKPAQVPARTARKPRKPTKPARRR